MKSRIVVIIILLSVSIQHAFSQNEQTAKDSLNTILNTTKDDSIKISVLRNLSFIAEDHATAIDFAQQAVDLARENDYPRLLGQSATSLGILFYELGNYEKTLELFYEVEAIYESLNDSMALARSYNNTGLILSDLGRVEETIEYHKLSLKIQLALKDEVSLANSYSNLGLAYEMLDSLDLAMTYYRKALSLDLKLNDTYGQYTSYSNIGKNHFRRKNYDSTAFYYNKAIMLSDQISNKFNKAELLCDYAALNAARNEFDRAMEKYKSSLMLALELESKQMIRNNYLGMSEVFKAQGDVNNAFLYYQKYDSVNELIFNEEQTQKLAEIEGNYQIQKGQKEIELLRKEAEIKDLRIRNNTFLTYFLAIAILMIVVIVILQYRKNIYKTRTNKILKDRNAEIADKNKDIMDSILYAKNIQKAILPSGDHLKTMVKDAFVFSKARDVVNGDFYWFAEHGEKIIIAAVDCTGHGVPAAFLNVLGNTHLNNIVTEHNVLAPGQILRLLNERMLASMHSNKIHVHADDGMDIGLCLFDKKTQALTFAGAKRPLYYFHNGELNILKGDSHPVGGDSYEKDRTFKQHELKLESGDSIYLFTDGIVDQFGGKKNKKFMYPRLRSLLKRIHEQPMDEQLMVIKDDLHTWQGDNEQTDDILIIGLRV